MQSYTYVVLDSWKFGKDLLRATLHILNSRKYTRFLGVPNKDARWEASGQVR